MNSARLPAKRSETVRRRTQAYANERGEGTRVRHGVATVARSSRRVRTTSVSMSGIISPAEITPEQYLRSASSSVKQLPKAHIRTPEPVVTQWRCICCAVLRHTAYECRPACFAGINRRHGAVPRPSTLLLLPLVTRLMPAVGTCNWL